MAPGNKVKLKDRFFPPFGCWLGLRRIAPGGDTMPGLCVGEPVADLTFLRPDGATVRLSEIPGPLLLVFLRHLR